MLEKHKYLSEQEQARLLDYWKGRKGKRNEKTFMFISFALNSGLRASEISNVRVEDLDLSSEFPSIRVRTLKQKVPTIDTVYISQKISKQLNRYIRKMKPDEYLFQTERGTQENNVTLYLKWTHALKKAGLKHYKLHSSRHTFATNLWRQSKDLMIVKNQLRHKSINSTMIYSHVGVEQISKVVNAI